jgi:hypothetical protein
MTKEFLGDRKKALEESFFAKENAKLLERLKAQRETQEARAALAEVSGIRSDEILEKLCALGIGAETWTAISIAPLVEVAWADGKIDAKERSAVLSAAKANGIASGSPGFELLEGWLAQRPDARLLEAWGAFIVGLCAQLEPRSAAPSSRSSAARAVAEAKGGFLRLRQQGVGRGGALLGRLAKAFES